MIRRHHLTVGALIVAGADSSSTVSYVIDRNPVPFPDSRPGRNAAWHKQVRTSVRIVIRGSGSIGNYDLTGNALFFVTRGDSTAIPVELRARGVQPDSTRWWLDRYEDETLAGSSVVFATNPSVRWTFGALLSYFLGLIVH